MILKNLALTNFRSFEKIFFVFSQRLTIISGPNTVGKTNILEAIYLLATAKSFRAEEEKEIISYGEEITRIKAGVETDSLEIVLTIGTVSGQIAPRKKYLVNGVAKRMVDFLGNLRAVLFWPEDLELVTDSPSIRRKYLDLVLCQVDREYARCLLAYEKGVRQRNKLLERIRDEGLSRSQLTFWNQLLIKNGGVLTEKRAEYINFINNFQFPMSNNQSSMTNFQLIYDKSVISESRLEQYAQNEVGAAVTLVGPHRDDVKFEIRNSLFGKKLAQSKQSETPRDLSLYGSRGEQRMAILWLKLGELEFMAQKTGERPILLLDDIFSELDEKHRETVLKIIPNQQTIMTTTDLHQVDKAYLKEVQIIEL